MVREQMELTLPAEETRAVVQALGFRRVCEARETCRIGNDGVRNMKPLEECILISGIY
jgi:hypothetical protein